MGSETAVRRRGAGRLLLVTAGVLAVALVAALLVTGALLATGRIEADDVLDVVLDDQCSAQVRAQAEQAADVIRAELPGLAGDVEVRGRCEDGPWPAVQARSTLERRELSTALSTRWGCRSAGSPGLSSCTDLDGLQANLQLDDDGSVVVEAFTDETRLG